MAVSWPKDGELMAVEEGMPSKDQAWKVMMIDTLAGVVGKVRVA